jgi:uncharacterized protein YodC (DUF2158 family)
MKVGDLVELSSAGRGTGYCQAMRKKTGIIVEIRESGMYPIDVHWFDGPGKVRHRRANLKFVSKPQKKSNIS